MQNGLWYVFLFSAAILVAAVVYAVYVYIRSTRRSRNTLTHLSEDAVHVEKQPAEVPESIKPMITSAKALEGKSFRETILPVHKEELYETQNIDTECFYFFKGARVLLVEDNRINQKIVKSVLQKSGIDLHIAENGEEALSLLHDDGDGFDLILMDISMPVMDGIEATRRIRMDERFDHIPIVTFTAFAGGEEIARMFRVGSNAFLTKPLNINQLYTAFKIYIKQTYRDTDMKHLLKTEGLDIDVGLQWAEGDVARYKARLEMFLHRYGAMYTLIPKWIDEKRYDRLKIECFQLQSILGEIGAYEMKALVDDMIKDFIYHNEHLLQRFTHLYPVVFKTLLNAIEQYLAEEADSKNVA